MPSVFLGNPQPIGDGATPGCVTEIDVPWSKSLEEAVRDISHDDGTANSGLWVAHSRAKSPSWVESDSPALAAALAAKWGCPVGRPA